MLSVYGLSIATDREFVAPLVERSGGAEIELYSTTEPSPHASLEVERHRIPYRTHAGPCELRVSRSGESIVLDFSSVGEFELRRDAIVCRPDEGSESIDRELSLLGPVLAVQSSLRGRLALHASAVEIAGGVVAFLAGSRGGKTSLASTLLQGGASLVTDDVLVVDRALAAQPSWPQIRLWPDSARHFLGHADLPLVHPLFGKRRVPIGPEGLGSFQSEPTPLRALYLPERVEAAGAPALSPRIEPVSGKDAVRALLANGFAARTMSALGDDAQLLEAATDLAKRVPVRRVVYPTGYERLAEAAEVVLADCSD